MAFIIGGPLLWPVLLFPLPYITDIPVGIVYAIWSGVGVVLVALIARIVYDQRLDLPAIIGMGLIVTGVAVMNLFSKSVAQ